MADIIYPRIVTPESVALNCTSDVSESTGGGADFDARDNTARYGASSRYHLFYTKDNSLPAQPLGNISYTNLYNAINGTSTEQHNYIFRNDITSRTGYTNWQGAVGDMAYAGNLFDSYSMHNSTAYTYFSIRLNAVVNGYRGSQNASYVRFIASLGNAGDRATSYGNVDQPGYYPGFKLNIQSTIANKHVLSHDSNSTTLGVGTRPDRSGGADVMDGYTGSQAINSFQHKVCDIYFKHNSDGILNDIQLGLSYSNAWDTSGTGGGTWTDCCEPLTGLRPGMNRNYHGGTNSDHKDENNNFPTMGVWPIPQMSFTDAEDFECVFDGEYHNNQMFLKLKNNKMNPISDERSAYVWVGTTSGQYPSGDLGVQQASPLVIGTSEGVAEFNPSEGTGGENSEGFDKEALEIKLLQGDGQMHVCDYTYYYTVENGRAYGNVDKKVRETGKSFKFKITKADPEFNPPTKVEAAYTGSAIAMANAGSLLTLAKNTSDIDGLKCKFQYSLNGTTWSDTIPKKTEVGEYRIYYKVKGNKDINDSAVGSFISKILASSVTVKVFLPLIESGIDIAGLDAASLDGSITWPGGTYDSDEYWGTKSFNIGDTLDFPNIQSFINNTPYLFSWDDPEDPSGCLMVGYSNNISTMGLTHYEGKTTTLTSDLNLWPRLMGFETTTYDGNFDNNNHNVKLKPGKASAIKTECVAATGVQVKVDVSAKDEPNAPTPTTVAIASTVGNDNDVVITSNYKNAGIYRVGIKFTITADSGSVVFTKSGHTTNNFIRIKKAPRNIQLNPATVNMDTNSTATATVTTWNDLDSSAATANVLSASARATVTPATVSKGGTVTITSGLAPGTVNINITIPETDNYLAETKPIIVNIASQGNGIWWYHNNVWVLTQPYVWNGSAWSEDFI